MKTVAAICCAISAVLFGLAAAAGADVCVEAGNPPVGARVCLPM